jgi:glycosyltransferase involved in cell wall biosynthesis
MPPHLMIADPYTGGHHGYYIEVLCRRWVELAHDERMTVVVRPEFRRSHRNLSDWIEQQHPQIVLIEDEFGHDRYSDSRSLIRQDLAQGAALARLVNDLRPDTVVLMYLDHFQATLASDFRFPFDLRVCGIYFRPTFHYRSVFGTQRSMTETLRDASKRMLLRLACRNPHLKEVCSLDPFLPRDTSVMRLRPKFIALAEPTPEPDVVARPPADTKVVSLVGALAGRKGVLQLLDAVLQLPADLRKRMKLRLAGPVADDIRQPLNDRTTALERQGSKVEVDDRFLDDAQVESAIGTSDLVTLPYQKHVGMSNLLVRAAKHGVPVLASDFGLIGALVEHHGLGLSVNAEHTGSIMQGLARFLENPDDFPFDSATAREFADRNTEHAFADAILGLPLPHQPPATNGD